MLSIKEISSNSIHSAKEQRLQRPTTVELVPIIKYFASRKFFNTQQCHGPLCRTRVNGKFLRSCWLDWAIAIKFFTNIDDLNICVYVKELSLIWQTSGDIDMPFHTGTSLYSERKCQYNGGPRSGDGSGRCIRTYACDYHGKGISGFNTSLGNAR